MNNVTSHQKGMTYLGMLILMITIAVAAIVVIKVMPLYMEHFKVQSSLKSLAQDAHGPSSPEELQRLLLNRLSINDVEHVTKDNIAITKQGGRTVVTVSYEARVPLFYNLDLVARFPEDSVDLGGP